MAQTGTRLLAGACVLAACTGSIPGTTPDRPPPGPTPITPGAPLPPSLKLAAGALRRLTVQQYANSVQDLLGSRTVVPPVEADASNDDDFQLTSVVVSDVVPSPSAVDQYDAAGRELARQLFADPARRDPFIGCSPVTDPCIKRFLAGFGRRAWRRPLTEPEVSRYAAAVAAMGDVYRGLEVATAALLASPNFVYRVEIGTPAPNTTRRTLDGNELATRLSYSLWDTTPDALLLDAAERGDLQKPELLAATLDRLLGSPRARRPLLTFFAEWLGTTGLDKNGLAKDSTVFPAATRTLAAAMYQEIEALVGNLVFDTDADLFSLYDTRQTFLTEELARLYGLPPGSVPAGSKPSPVTLPDGPRGGFFTTGAFLALNARASMTSPTLRGLFIRERMFCQHVPPPPADVDTTIPPPPPGKIETARERLTRHMSDATCAGCHKAMDPVGLALENFDGLGAYRADDGGKPILATGEIDGVTFEGAPGLAKLVRQNPVAVDCALQQLVHYLTGSGDVAVSSSMAAALAPAWKSADGRLKTVLRSFAQSELFRTVEATR